MQHNMRMDIAMTVGLICDALKERGEPGTLSQVARLLDVSPSTVTRWVAGETRPTAKQIERLELLDRTIRHAESGNPDAKRILAALLSGTGARLLGLGLTGILIAAGLAWLVSGGNENGQKGSGS